jgi:hypothetical protein
VLGDVLGGIMEKKQLTSRKVRQTGKDKKIAISNNMDAVKQPIEKSTTPIPKAQDNNKAKSKGFVKSATEGWFIWEIVIPVGVALFSIIFLITEWFLSLFVKNALEIIWLTVAVFGVGGAISGWFWKKAKISAVIGAAIGVVLALACVTFIEDIAYSISLGPCILGC